MAILHFPSLALPSWLSVQTPRQKMLRRTLLANLVVLCSILGVQILSIWQSLPDVTAESFLLPQSVVLTDSKGAEIRRIYIVKDRLELSDESFPVHLKQAVIAIEDRRFETRGCVDIHAIGRATVANVRNFKSEGASTITQQLVGNLMLDRGDKSFTRKALELMLACKLENAASRDRIVSLYLNHMAFGGMMSGPEEAAQIFFGISAKDLSLAQSAVLAALIQKPTYYSPFGSHVYSKVPDDVIDDIRKGTVSDVSHIPADQIDSGLIGKMFRSLKGDGVYIAGRTDKVLEEMSASGFITDEEMAAANRELQTMTFQRKQGVLAMPYFSLLVQKQLNEGVFKTDRPCDLEGGGCIVKTTLDTDYQALAEKIVSENAAKIRETYGAKNIALVAADRKTGHVLAYVGNVSFGDTEPGSMIDMAASPRQPGSSFKPFVYANAFAHGMNPTTFLLDAPLTLGGEQPQNYEGGYRDWTQVSHALAASRNIPAIRALLLSGGEDPVLDTAYAAGITYPREVKDEKLKTDEWFRFGYPLAIGSAEVPLFQMVQGYLTLANAGTYIPLSTIDSVTTVDGKPLDTKMSVLEHQAIEPLFARWLTGILSDTSIRPTPRWSEALTVPGLQTAVKTGTSSQCVTYIFAERKCLLRPGDVWTMGYSPEFVLGIWVGNADNQALSPNADGMNVVAPMWKEFMKGAHELRPEGLTYFPQELIANRKEAR